MPHCLEQAIQRTFELDLVTGLKPYFDGIKAALHQPQIEIIFIESFGIRTDAQLDDGISSVSFSN